MDKITDVKTEFRLRQWTGIIQDCQASGMTVAAWCNQNNIKPKSYYYWLRRIRSLACESGLPAASRDEKPMIPLSFKQRNTSAAVTIHLSSISVDIHEGASRATIETVLSVLKHLC